MAFASCALHGGEKNYHLSKLEFLALKWAITKQFCKYLQYGHFTIRTDNNPLTYVLMTPNLDAIGHWWVAALAGFNINIEYLRGTDNKVADTLSRVSVWLDKDTVNEILEHAKNSIAPRAETDNPRLVQQVEIMEEDFIIQVQAITDEDPMMKRLQQADWPMLKHYDPTTWHILDWVQLSSVGQVSLGDYLERKVPDGIKRWYALRQKDFIVKQQMLYLKMMPLNTQEEVFAFVMPRIKWRAALDGCHRSIGHQGWDWTLSLLKEQFWWPSMAKEAALALKNCRQCLIFEAKVQTPKLAPILATKPMDLVHIDFIKMEILDDLWKKPKMKNVLVIVDHFMRFMQVNVTKDQMAHTVARVLYDKYFAVFWFPRCLLSDKACAFCGNVIAQMCDYLQIDKIHTSPYHPQSNGQVEHIHQTLLRMIGKLEEDKHKDWPKHLGSLVHAYNTMRSWVMGFPPITLCLVDDRIYQ